MLLRECGETYCGRDNVFLAAIAAHVRANDAANAGTALVLMPFAAMALVLRIVTA